MDTCTIDDYGLDEVKIDYCGTCDKKQVKVAVFHTGVRLCHECLVDLANLLNEHTVD